MTTETKTRKQYCYSLPYSAWEVMSQRPQAIRVVRDYGTGMALVYRLRPSKRLARVACETIV